MNKKGVYDGRYPLSVRIYGDAVCEERTRISDRVFELVCNPEKEQYYGELKNLRYRLSQLTAVIAAMQNSNGATAFVTGKQLAMVKKLAGAEKQA